jgi:hypothetical protein
MAASVSGHGLSKASSALSRTTRCRRSSLGSSTGRGLLSALLLLLLTACGSGSTGPGAQSTVPPQSSMATPTPPVTPQALSSGGRPNSVSAPTGLHAVHSPRQVFDDAHLQRGQCRLRFAAGGQPLPDPACTPGAVDPAVSQSNIATTICRPGYTATVRPPAADTDRWKRSTETAYGNPGPAE